MNLTLFDGSLTGTSLVLLLVSVGVALAFECVNGFHDTANAVATVIYTRALEPGKAVAWSGLCNFVGVYFGGTAVAFRVVHLLPVDLLVTTNHGAALAMVLSLLTAAIAWNLGTWALGLPASSSHTLVGAILGVGLTHAYLTGRPLAGGVNWAGAGEVALSLLVSPLVGFVLAAGLLRLMKRVLSKQTHLFDPPPEDGAPPFWVRSTLIATCTGVSLAHGSNDGQKGVGLLMLILIGLLPAHYALNPTHKTDELARVFWADETLRTLLETHAPAAQRSALRDDLIQVRTELQGKTTLADVPRAQRWALRSRLVLIGRALENLEKHPPENLGPRDLKRVKAAREALESAVDFAPPWTLASVALALGLGTTIGWKRIVVTVGEKIGKAHLTYGQGASAEIVAAGTIGLADLAGLPVSTTHVLSSGVAGTMLANGSGLQFKTVRNIALAWLLTLPAAMGLAGAIYAMIHPFLDRLGPSLHS